MSIGTDKIVGGFVKLHGLDRHDGTPHGYELNTHGLRVKGKAGDYQTQALIYLVEA